MGNSEISSANERIHSEAPAEGDAWAQDPGEIRLHSQEPAEGEDLAAEGDTRPGAPGEQSKG